MRAIKRERRYNWRMLGAIIAVVWSVGWCWGDLVEPISPRPAQIFGWGRQSPAVRLEARAVLSAPANRVFISAIISDAKGTVIDRVPLYDDGTHGDTQAADLLFTEIYTPRREGVFQVRFKIEWERDGQRRTRFSEPRAFEVVRVPYARFVSKLAQERLSVGSVVDTQVALLVGNDDPYRGSLDAVTLRVASYPASVAEPPKTLTTRPTVRYQFDQPGEYQLSVQALTTYKGQQIATEPDTLTVVYNCASLMWLVWGIAAMLAGLLLPSKKTPVYEHEFVEEDRQYGTRRTLTITDSDPSCEIRSDSIKLEYIQGSEQVLLASGTLTTADGETLTAGERLSPSEQYRLPSGKTLKFTEAYPIGSQSLAPRWVPNTFPKLILVAVGVGLSVWYFVLQNRLTQLTNL
ncbi:MAG: hypothetical protein P3X24_000815 [bacterium]|nr:hypothetical protein [bacterium]